MIGSANDSVLQRLQVRDHRKFPNHRKSRWSDEGVAPSRGSGDKDHHHVGEHIVGDPLGRLQMLREWKATDANTAHDHESRTMIKCVNYPVDGIPGRVARGTNELIGNL